MEDNKKTDKEAEKKAAEKRKGLVLARRSRRLQQRTNAKALGHKLGSKNRRCKRCGSARTAPEFAASKCTPKKGV